MSTLPASEIASVRDWALRYAKMGWPVFPLSGKHPLPQSNGFKDASTDEAKVGKMWKTGSHYNVGIATGFAFWVLDIDLKTGGDDSLESLELKHGKLPPTLQQITGTGGRHYLFQVPQDLTVKNSAGAVAPGIDVRGVGGYIVAPPSVHPDTGRNYAWDGLNEIEQDPILPAPEWLIDAIRKHQSHNAPALTVIPLQITAGGRNDLLFRRAASLRNHGFEKDELISVLTTLNTSRCNPPLPIPEIIKIAESVCKYPPGMSARYYNQQVNPVSIPEENTELLPDWREKLQCTAKGTTLTNAFNAALPLLYDPDLHGAVAYDQLRRQISIMRPIPFEANAPCPWEDRHDIAFSVWCQANNLNISVKTAAEAATLVAQKNKHHPVRQYLDGLEWDGCPRISRWLPFYCGTEDTPYAHVVGRKWMIAAVARAMTPGCKVDTCLILEGEQGIMKSTALAALGGEWYTDEIEDLTSKDAAMQASRVWIVEMGELSAMSRTEKAAVKAFLSRSVDQFRPAYGRHIATMPRQCVFAGTTNQREYLEDETGNRRFWPILCTRIQIEELKRDRDQLWAEAVAAFNEGECWWLEDDQSKKAAQDAAADRLREDPWTSKIYEWVTGRLATGSDGVTVAEIMGQCLEIPERDWKRNDQMRVGTILKQMNMSRNRTRQGGTLIWLYSMAPASVSLI